MTSRLLRLLAHCPLRMLHAAGRLGGRLVYACPGRYRRRLQQNAAQAGYRTASFARRAAAETGAMILETPRIWQHVDASLSLAHSPDDDVVRAAQAEGRGIVYLTPHLGCYEIIPHYLLRHGPLTVMYRPPRVPWLEPLVASSRNAHGLHAVPASRQGIRAFLKALRRGESIGLLPDQVPGGGDGVWAPFFGKPAYTMTLAARLIQQTGVAVVLAAGERLPGSRGWRIHFMRLPEPLPDNVQALATAINAAMETLIQRFPEQYLWGYNRYKIPPDAPPRPPWP